MRQTVTPLSVSSLLRHCQMPDHTQMHEAQRVFHGRGHAYADLHHITIDWLPPLLHITVFAPVAKATLLELVTRLQQRVAPECKNVQVQHRYTKDWHIETLLGEPVTQLVINESDLRYQLRFKSGTNTGLFLDMKNGRDWVRAQSQNKRVLNLFAYTCGFSVAAAAGGAKSVFNIDLSSTFLAQGRENHRLNHHDLAHIQFAKLNIMKSFGRIKKQAPYDLIICDPPTFQKGSVDLVRDYPKLLRRLTDFLASNGTMLLCINSPDIAGLTGREFLLNVVANNAPTLQFVKAIKSPAVFVDKQGKGTQCLVFKQQKLEGSVCN